MKPENPADQIDMQALINAPLADPLKTFVPLGTRAAKRGPRFKHYDGLDLPRLTGKEMEDRKEDAHSAKVVALLDYYATTTIPVDRIAQHTGLSPEDTAAAMKRRGREI